MRSVAVRGRRILLVAFLPIAAGWLFLSCSRGITKPETAVKKMYSAYRGERGVARITSFTGYGFMKDLSSRTLARSDPFDIFRKGERYKHRRYKVVKGKVKDISVVCYDGKTGFEYMYSKGMRDVPEWEFYILKYKFPVVVKWARDNLDKARGVECDPGNSTCTVRFENMDDVVDVTIDGKNGWLKKVRITSKKDSSFSYEELYGDYREVDGIPFPSRFVGKYKGSTFYEFFLPTIELGVDIPDTLFRLNPEDTSEFDHEKQVE